MLKDAGFTAVQIIDTRSDLNAYSKVEGSSGCCSAPAAASEPSGPALPVTEEEWIASSQGGCGTQAQTSRSCCSTEPAAEFHEEVSGLLARYNVNEFAASVRVFAVKP
jgi:arsenite methyltransferase